MEPYVTELKYQSLDCIFQEGGRIKVRYNLGSREIEIGEYDVTVNDGRYHVLK